MHIESRNIAVTCHVLGACFGLPRGRTLSLYVVGSLVLAQPPYLREDGVVDDGYPAHFEYLSAFTESLWPVLLAGDAQFEAVEAAALCVLRMRGEIEDEDEEILRQYS